ncbi:malectin-A [Trichonephila clavata]|uniref:Malectin-A n=1 Tax=Trichonephila clavata TaxID=2740835 RepID=A0A8X6F5A8_TRICU|nr:malectin-A [Trichonephila clavata]
MPTHQLSYLKHLFIFILVLCLSCELVSCLGEIIYAINAGGESHVDSDGIHYRRDPLHGRIGTASDYGKQLIISRVPRTDQVLYQTERYHHATFGYEIPVNKDGDYVLVLKFCEVYFSSPGMKVFDVTLNGVHTVVSDLDIFAKVGKGVAHDEHIPFIVKGNKLIVNEEESEHDGKIRVEFIKGYRDNPKVNAIYVARGSTTDVPQLPSLASDEKDEEEEETTQEKKASPIRYPSGPRIPNPYETEDSSTMLPIFIAIGAFLPLLFCLCRL